ncbi:armadillo repeat protein [Pseudomassariella vexata]|uniref:Armadillo repeat protein n=1 Tax=Pseudomassariella vexata TaxID=1141098 RepID=A0A1Y2DXP5_9PEZI|nr:armadillo repeat protein [Pseudomassariella vexata]ORY64072.1 armadillo repeat protein [Pseudomassariella vexata]
MAFNIAQLSSPRLADQLSALRSLKNEVVGHSQKKEQWVQAGVLRPIVSIVEGASEHVNGKDSRQRHPITRNLSDDEAVKLHALQLLATFANAGTVFLLPLHAAGALSAILSSSCLQHERSQIVLAALRVLRGIVEAVAFVPAFSPINSTYLADTIFSSSHLEPLAFILTQSHSNRDVEAQVSIVAKFIGILCQEERHRVALVNCGVLDALATRLAAFAVAEGQVIPGAEIICRSAGLSGFIPSPASPALDIADVLGAIAAIITDSPFRTCRLLYSPCILAVFPRTDCDWEVCPKSSPEFLELPGLKPTRQNEFEPMDLLLPYMPVQLRGQTTPNAPFPPLGSTSLREGISFHSRVNSKANNQSWGSNDESFMGGDESDVEEAESPLVPWLIGLVRFRDGLAALTAASVLTSLFKCGFAYKMREITLGLLVVPKLLQLLDTVEEKANHTDTSMGDAETATIWGIIERAPAILARLITDSESLQKAAFDSGAVKTICRLLKNTYDTPPPLNQARPWSPNAEDERMPLNSSPSCQLGEPGMNPLARHRVKVRESSLKSLAALAAFKEEYRKAFVDQDIIPYVVESLRQSPHQPKQLKEKSSSDTTAEEAPKSAGFGKNPPSVNIEACYAVRMLSRSVNILRTSLVDHAVAIPLYKLLLHSDLKVQVAATAAMCNLVTDFSPMRETLTDAGLTKVLCDHARSQNADLRLNALWALKHLVHSASIDLKKNCLEELQSGWLVQLIRDEKEDEALHSARRGDTQHSQGVFDDVDEDMDMDDQIRSPCYRHASALLPSDSHILRLADARLSKLREAESNPLCKVRRDDLAIQEQGLGFIRNLIGGAYAGNITDQNNDTPLMIDHLFNTLGHDELFRILASKLRVKVLHPFSGRRGPTGSETRVLYPQAKIIEAVIYILVHMAASIPRHRQLVVAQTELLRLLAGLFSSQDREVRVALCYLINNLTWQDDVHDAPACSQRATELKKLGFLTKLESLGQNDNELDVRERAKTALWQMKHGY